MGAVTLKADDPWNAECELLADPDPPSEYGYHTGQERRACSREELRVQCCTVPSTPCVWTPETGKMVRPEAVPFLVEELARYRLRSAEREIRWYGLGLVVVLGIYALWLPTWGFRSLLVLVPGFLAIGLASAIRARVEALRTDASAFPAARAWLGHAAWVQKQPAHYTKALLGLLIAIYMAEAFADRDAAIQAAGLVKPAVRDGEVWRLMTGALLHGNGTHIWTNGGALFALGRLIEAHSRREYVPLIFLISALTGSVLSVLADPIRTSVGASGGIMGLMGFLLVLGHRRRGSLPPGFVGGILFSIAAMAIFGIVGFAVIDNAAHLGGLIGGVLLGYALERYGVMEPGESAHDWLYGYIASAVIVAGAVVAVAAMYN